MAAVTTMANERLRTLWSHLSPPVIVTTSSMSPPSSASCPAEFGHAGEFQSSCSGNLGSAALECAGPNSAREAKLLENLMLSRLRRFYTRRDTRNADLGLLPCGAISQDMAEQHADVVELESKELAKYSDRGDPETRSEERDCDCGLFGGERVRSGITSASAVSSSGAVDGKSLPKAKLDSKLMSHLTAASRVAACEFCDIIQGAAPCFKLYEDELCLCILDINPLSAGHSLILPKSHFPCLEATPPQVAAAMCAAVPLISRALLAATRCDSFNMLVNSGVAAGQVIMHTHFHIIPRCKGDGLWKSESATRKPMRKVQEAKLLAQAVRIKLSSTVGSGT